MVFILWPHHQPGIHCQLYNTCLAWLSWSYFVEINTDCSLVAMVSGGGDGGVRVWHVGHRKTMWSTAAHHGIVEGVAISHTGSTFMSCGCV